ncbi:MAG: hypothetical protein ACN4G0_13420 [Polyangiales bacterium]
MTVEMRPALTSTYDAAVVLDDKAATFTCEMRRDGGWSVTAEVNHLSIGWCSASELTVLARDGDSRYDSVDVRISAQDGSWEGSATAVSSYYTNYPNGPKCGPGCSAARIVVLQDGN